MAENSSSSERLTALAAQVASSYVSRNDVALADLPQVIATIYQSLGIDGRRRLARSEGDSYQLVEAGAAIGELFV